MPVVPSDRWSLRAVPYVLIVAAVLFFSDQLSVTIARWTMSWY